MILHRGGVNPKLKIVFIQAQGVFLWFFWKIAILTPFEWHFARFVSSHFRKLIFIANIRKPFGRIKLLNRFSPPYFLVKFNTRLKSKHIAYFGEIFSINWLKASVPLTLSLTGYATDMPKITRISYWVVRMTDQLLP